MADRKYQKQENRTNNLNGNTNNSSTHNNNDKNNNFVGNNNKNNYENNIIIITIKMAQLDITTMITMAVTIFLIRKTITLIIIVTKTEIRINE